MNVIAMVGLTLCWAGLIAFGGWLAMRENNDKD